MLVIFGSKGDKSDDAQTWKVLFGILICKYKTTRAFLLLDDLYPFVFMIHTVNTSLHTFFTQMKKMKILIILFLVIKGKELLYWLYICLSCLNRIPNIFES